jgi:hypothetical protein
MNYVRDNALWPGLWRHSAAIFLATLVLFYLSAPYLEGLEHERLWMSATFTLVLFTGALAVGERKKLMTWAGILAAAAFLPLWISHLWPGLLLREYSLVTGFLFALFVSIRLVRFLLRAPVVDSEVLCAAAATYLMLSLALTLMYILVGIANPQAFAWTVGTGPHRPLDGFTALYFSLTTQATLGYGDIVPASPTARLLVMVQAVGGMFYMTLLVARLVSVYSSEHNASERKSGRT